MVNRLTTLAVVLAVVSQGIAAKRPGRVRDGGREHKPLAIFRLVFAPAVSHAARLRRAAGRRTYDRVCARRGGTI